MLNRRAFLKVAMLAGAGLALPQCSKDPDAGAESSDSERTGGEKKQVKGGDIVPSPREDKKKVEGLQKIS